MRKVRLFQNTILESQKKVTLDEDSAHRLLTVLRAKKNDPLVLFNGDGHEYSGIITHIERKKVIVHVAEKTKISLESPIHVHLGQVISKGEKMDTVIQKATELGVTKITPLFSKRSLPSLKMDRLDKKHNHWHKIAIHASEQCGRTCLPILEKPISLDEWIHQRPETTRLLFDPRATHSLKTIAFSNSIVLLVGPEGGFSEDEIHNVTTNGFTSLQLGPRILRTETAALAAITAIQCHAGDFG